MELHIVIRLPTWQELNRTSLRICKLLFGFALKNSVVILCSLAIHALLLFSLVYLLPQPSVSGGQNSGSKPISISLGGSKNSPQTSAKSSNKSQNSNNVLKPSSSVPIKTLSKTLPVPREFLPAKKKDLAASTQNQIQQPQERLSSVEKLENLNGIANSSKSSEFEDQKYNPNSAELVNPKRNPKLYPNGQQLGKEEALGSALGAEASGEVGAPDAPIVKESQPIVDGGPVRNKIVETEFNTEDYKMRLGRQFADAWGPVRTLPQGSFVGNVGELIEYEIWLQRDGSLIKVVNLSHIRNPYRDFKAVDELVERFYEVVTPMAPIPDRIKTIPFRMRMALRYGGLTYSW